MSVEGKTQRVAAAVTRAKIALARWEDAQAAEDAARAEESAAVKAVHAALAASHQAAIDGVPPRPDYREHTRVLAARLHVDAAEITAKGQHDAVLHAIADLVDLRNSA